MYIMYTNHGKPRESSAIRLYDLLFPCWVFGEKQITESLKAAPFVFTGVFAFIHRWKVIIFRRIYC